MNSPQMRSRFWTFLSLWALLALAAPQLLWACPAMGKMMDSPHASCCCQKKIQSDSTQSKSLAANDNAVLKCCEKVPLPASDTSGENEKVALSGGRDIASLLDSLLLPATPALLPSLETFEPQSTLVAIPPTIPFLLTSQHIPRLTSGRAPPL